MKIRYYGDTMEVDALDAFELFGEKFAVHRTVPRDGTFRASHVGTGFGVPSSFGDSIEEARENALTKMARLGEEKVKAAIAKAPVIE